MTTTESHSVRNGVIATVIGGIALAALSELWPPAKKAGLWLFEQASWLVGLFADTYSIQGWALALLVLLPLVTLIRFVVALKQQQPAPFTSYVEDLLFGAKWRWLWQSGEISNLWCFCPRCDSELVYDDSSCHNIYASGPSKTDFICEHCGHATVATITGGNKSYAISAVQREIRRRIRTNEYARPPQQES
jgi:hypothetical protein